MMDYMSNYDPPSRELSIKEIKQILSLKYEHIHISDNFLQKKITFYFDNITKNGTERGSYTGWCTYEQPKILQLTIESINSFLLKKKRVISILKTLYILNKIYLETLKRYYAPGNPGMIKCYKNFEELKIL
tara:strand:+ start:3376 stop:3768 length:393 start_codon:yes stop_codon:yes gene_type:complete